MHRVLSGGVACLGLVIAFTACGGEDGEGAAGADNPDNNTSGGTTGDQGGSGGNVAPLCAPVGEVIPVSAGEGSTPSIAWRNGLFAVAWQARESVTDEVRVALISPDGTKQSEHVLAGITAGPALPKVHPTESGFVVVWQDAGAAGSVIRAQQLGADGSPASGPFDVGSSGVTEARPSSALVKNGVAIAWMEPQDTRFGVLSGSSMGPMTTLPGARFPAVASRGGDAELALAWSNGATLSFARATNPGGAPQMMNGATMRTGPGEAKLPRVAAGGGQWFVAWEDTRSGAERVYLSRVDGNDKPLGEVRVEEDEGSANWPDVAWTGTHAAVAYYQFQDGPPAVYLKLYTPDLSVATSPIKLSGKNARFPAVTVAGAELGVAWSIKDGGVEFVRVACE
jgi:hypothetical protein